MPYRSFVRPGLYAVVPLLGSLLSAQQPGGRAHRLAVVDTGLLAPEALSFDAALDVYFVSNVNGPLGLKDNNGYITRIRGSDGHVDSLHFIQSGRAGVTLNSPTGSRVKGDTLWVLDVDALRGFDVRTGAPMATIDLSKASPLFLNDVALGPDNDFYITDSGLRVSPDGKADHTGPDRILHVARDRSVTVALSSPKLMVPDGIDWDRAHRRLVLAPFGGPAVQAWTPGADAPTDVAPGKGKFDGIEIEPDGMILITSWGDSSVNTLRDRTLVRQFTSTVPPADVSLDAHRHRVGIVALLANRFELWSLP